jgi:regulator of replication initiation timing
MKKYIGAILSIGTVVMLFYTLFDLKNQVKQIPVLEHQLDSLRDETFIISTENGRYELSLEHLKEVNPKAAKEFEQYLTTQTE